MSSTHEKAATASAAAAKQEHVSQGGPTTEAGKQKKEQVHAEKEAKQERKREKNGKKRAAYRARNREKNGIPSHQTKRSQFEKKKEHRNKEPKESRQEKRERRRKEQREQAKQEKKERRRRVREACNGTSFRLTEAEREVLLANAVKKSEFATMQQLFIVDMVSNASGSDDPIKSVTKRYRLLSCRYHPDKHASEAECYKLAFQALNEAHEVSKERFM